MSSKEQDELVLEEATQQGQQIEYGNGYDYAGDAAVVEGGSSSNENKWNKNGFGQGKHDDLKFHFPVLLGGKSENRN